MTPDDLLFDMPVPPGWESRLQMTYIEPLPPKASPDDLEKPAPRVNIVVSRVPTEEVDPFAVCEEFLTQTASAVPDLDLVEEPAAFKFDDGVDGVVVRVRFAAQPQLWLEQHHAFRIDAKLTTQLVATAADSDAAERGPELRAMLAKFRLKSL